MIIEYIETFEYYLCEMQNVQFAKAALRPGAGIMVNEILQKLVVLKVLRFAYYISLNCMSVIVLRISQIR
jgi:hypothetical protein